MLEWYPAAERQPISNHETYRPAYSSSENGEVEGGGSWFDFLLGRVYASYHLSRFGRSVSLCTNVPRAWNSAGAPRGRRLLG